METELRRDVCEPERSHRDLVATRGLISKKEKSRKKKTGEEDRSIKKKSISSQDSSKKYAVC